MEILLSKLINPQPKQVKALETLFDPICKYLLYGGAMSGGKSYILRWAAFSYVYYLFLKTGIKGIPVGLFSEDYPTLKDRQISRIEREFPRWIGELKDDKIDGLSFKVRDKYGAGKILLRNLDDPSKYMSTEFAGEFVEEMTRNRYQTFEDLRNRLRYPGIDEVKFMGASNPGGIGHGWVKKLFIDRNSDDIEQERFFYVHANAYDNKYISKEYIKQLESLPEQQRKAYLEGSWDVFAGQFFTEWRSHHVCKYYFPLKSNVIVGGLDWGRADPFATEFTEIKTVEYNGQKFFRATTFVEIYGTERTPKEWGKVIEDTLKESSLTLHDISWMRCDTQIFNPGLDKSKSIADQFIDYNEKFRTLLKPASKERIGGWENLHNWLSMAPDGLPYWQIAQNCNNLIRTLPSLVHDENKVEDVDQAGEDHAPDAVRYQFKHLKWIDAKLGGVVHPGGQRLQLRTAEFVGSKQVSIDLSAWETPTPKTPDGEVGAILH